MKIIKGIEIAEQILGRWNPSDLVYIEETRHNS